MMLHASRSLLLRPNAPRHPPRHCFARRSVQIVCRRSANGEYSSAAADVAATVQSEQAAVAEAGAATAAAAAAPASAGLDSVEQKAQQQQLQVRPEPADNVLYIARLRNASTDDDLAELFNGQTGLQKAFMYQNVTGNRVGYAIFDSSESSAAAAKALNNKQFKGKTLTVKVHRKDPDQEDKPRTRRNKGQQQQKQNMPGAESAASSSSSSVDAAAAQEQQQDGSQHGRQLRKQENVLVVLNLAWRTMSEDLKEHFKGCDGVTDAFITYNKDGRPSGNGFAVFSTAEAAYAAAKVMHESVLDDRVIVVRRARAGVVEAPDPVAAGRLAVALSGAAPNEQRVVIRNGPENFSLREFFGMCSVFGTVEYVTMRMPGQLERRALRNSSSDGESSSSSSSPQAQYAIVRMADRGSAERVVEGLNGRKVQGQVLDARLYRLRPQQLERQQQQQSSNDGPQQLDQPLPQQPQSESSQGSE